MRQLRPSVAGTLIPGRRITMDDKEKYDDDDDDDDDDDHK